MRRLVLIALWLCWAAGAALAAASEPQASAGCGRAPAPPPELIEVDGRLRQAIVALPRDYRADRLHALVFAFHGRTNDNAKARRYFRLEEAVRQPTIFVYPAGLADDAGGYSWWQQGERADALRDFRLFDALLAAMADGFCIDLDAVHVVGHSLGASFANSLACARADRIRSVVSVAGGINPTHCSGEVAALLLHNPHDRLVPISEGERARDILLGRTPDGDAGEVSRVGAFTCAAYRQGADPLLWCLQKQDRTRSGRYYPHQWPEGMAEAFALFIDRLTSGPLAAAFLDQRSSDAGGTVRR